MNTIDQIISDFTTVPQTISDFQNEVTAVKWYMIVTVAALAYLVIRSK